MMRHLPDTSDYKRALSPTGWSEAEEIAAKTHEAVATNLAAKFSGAEDAPDFLLFIPPNERATRAFEELVEQRETSEAEDELYSDMFGE